MKSFSKLRKKTLESSPSVGSEAMPSPTAAAAVARAGASSSTTPPKGGNTSPKIKPMLILIDEPVEPSAHSSFASRVARESSSSALSIDTSVAGDVAGSFASASPSSPGSPKARESDSQSQMRGFSKVSFRIKQLVSKEKRRFEEGGFNLDLTYVTSRLIAFGYPAESLEGIYRNHYKDVYNFFEQRHPERYRIYNLCTERSYDKEKFHNRVAEFRFDDHCPPPLALFLPFCQDVDAWLQEHPENVAAIHCKAGKGRTGVMICAYLLYTGAWKTAEGAMQFFGAVRSLKSQGVTIPSQRRFITYFGEMCHRARRMELDGDGESSDSDDEADRPSEGRERSSDDDESKHERELSSVDFKRLWEEALEGRGVTTKRQMFQCQPKIPATVHLKVVSIKLSGVYCQKKLDPRVYIECGRKSDRPPAGYDLNAPFSGTTMTAPRAASTTPRANGTKELDSSSQDDSEPPPAASASAPPSPSSRSSTASACLDMELVLTDRCIVWDEVKVVLRNRNGGKIGHFWFHTAFVKRAQGGRLELTLAKVELDKVVKDIKHKHKKYAPTFGVALVFERATAEEIEAAEFAQRVAALKVDTSTTSGSSFASRFSVPGSMSPGKMKAWANKRSDGAIYQFSRSKTSPSPPDSDDRVRANSDSGALRRLDDAGIRRARINNGSAAVQLDAAKSKRISDVEVFAKNDELDMETLDGVTRPVERASASPKAQSSSPKSSLCLLDGDMTRELEEELDDANTRSYARQTDSGGGTGGNSGGGAPFATTSLLAADEVMCLDVIGEGPFGMVYEGRYRGSAVAVKKMKMTTRPMKPAARETMEMELEVEATRMGTLRHPNTVLFMGACVQGEYFCVVSEYCTRGSLFDVLHPLLSPHRRGVDKAPPSRGKAPASGGGAAYHSSDGAKKKKGIKWSVQLRLALGAAKGLLYLHSADPPLVHGQLKSSNILVDDSWNAKLADFGTRRVADAMGFDRSRLESMDANSGLLRWTAPELLKHGEERVLKGNASAGTVCPQAVDVYSFGIVLWELTTGEVPFAEMQSNREIRECVLSGGRPTMKPGQCNIQWGELITRCWSQNARQRPSAAEIVTTLESISKTDARVQREIRVVNSNRTEYRFDPDRPRTRTNGKFRSNVRLPPS